MTNYQSPMTTVKRPIERNYDEGESCRFEFKYILTVNGLDKLLVFCENTFKCTWKVILETYNVKKNTLVLHLNNERFIELK